MALKDITLGQYFPGRSLVHRLDPRTKLLAVILYIVALFNAQGVVTYAIVAALLALSLCAMRRDKKKHAHEGGCGGGCCGCPYAGKCHGK